MAFLEIRAYFVISSIREKSTAGGFYAISGIRDFQP